MSTHEATSRAYGAQRMRRMIRRLGVDLLELAYVDLGRAYAGAAQACLTCENAGECSRWLDAKSGNAEPPAFCPNLRLFERFAPGRSAGDKSATAAGDASALHSNYETSAPAAWRGNPILKLDAQSRWAISVVAVLWSTALIALALASVTQF